MGQPVAWRAFNPFLPQAPRVLPGSMLSERTMKIYGQRSNKPSHYNISPVVALLLLSEKHFLL